MTRVVRATTIVWVALRYGLDELVLTSFQHPGLRLAARIAWRFHLMLDQGALDEVRAVLPDWDASALWAKAIGAPELVAHLQGRDSLDKAVEKAIIATRQYAKAQRSFFRGRMRDWWQIAANH